MKSGATGGNGRTVRGRGKEAGKRPWLHGGYKTGILSIPGKFFVTIILKVGFSEASPPAAKQAVQRLPCGDFLTLGSGSPMDTIEPTAATYGA